MFNFERVIQVKGYLLNWFDGDDPENYYLKKIVDLVV